MRHKKPGVQNRTRRDKGRGSLRWIVGKKLWEARVSYRRSDGTRAYKSAYCKDENEGYELLAKLRKEYGGAVYKSEGQNLEDYLTAWLRGQMEQRAPATYRVLKLYVEKRIVPMLGKKKLASVSVDDVKALDAALRREGVGIPTRHAVLKTLSSALSSAVREQLIPQNVATLVSKPKVVPVEKYILSLEEAQKLLEFSKATPYHALFVLAITTGMRQGELFGLKWSDVDLDNGQVFVRSTLGEDSDGKLRVKAPKTKASRRTIVIPLIAIDALRTHQNPIPAPDDFVFTDSEGNPIRKSNFLRRTFAPLVETAGLPRITFHSLPCLRQESRSTCFSSAAGGRRPECRLIDTLMCDGNRAEVCGGASWTVSLTINARLNDLG